MKKILIIISSIIFVSCNNGYKKLGNDLYKKGDQLFIRKTGVWFEKKNEGDTIEIYDSICYFEDRKPLSLNKVVDVASFKKTRTYYYDKNNLYIYNTFPAFFPSLNVIKAKEKKFVL